MKRHSVVFVLQNDNILSWHKEVICQSEYFLNIKSIYCIQGKSKKNLIYNFIDNLFNNKVKLSNDEAVNYVYKLDDQFYKKLSVESDIVVCLGLDDLFEMSKITNQFGVVWATFNKFSREFDAILSCFCDNYANINIDIYSYNTKIKREVICNSFFSKFWKENPFKSNKNLYYNVNNAIIKALINIDNINLINNYSQHKIINKKNEFIKPLFYFICFFIAKIIYGVFFEKKWNIAFKKSHNFFENNYDLKFPGSDYCIPYIDKIFTFYADPFIDEINNLIYTEALNKYTGLGNIVLLDTSTGNVKNNIFYDNHYSYPSLFTFNNKKYLLPEMSRQNTIAFFDIDNNFKKININEFDGQKLVDSTYFYDGNFHYIFTSPHGYSSDNLLLFYSPHLTHGYMPHPLNPIVIDASCARMAGAIISYNDRIYRLGQNNNDNYGGGLHVCEITVLSPTEYQETKLSEVRLPSPYKGPHTLNFSDNFMVLDFYTDRFSWLAGFRRLLNKFKKSK